MTSLLWRKTRLLGLTEFSTVSTGVLVALVRGSSFVLVKPYCREELFLFVLLKVGPFLSPRRLVPMTLEGLFVHLTHFVRWHCAIVITSFLPLLSVKAFTGTPWGAFTLPRDASLLGKWQTTSLRLRPLLWPTSRVLHKTQVSFSLTLRLLIPVSITLGSSLCSRTLDCPNFSAASYEAFTRTALHTWNLREQNEDNSWWPEAYDKVVLRAAFFLQWLLILSSDGSKSPLHQGTPTIWSSCSLHNVLTLTISPLLHRLSGSWCFALAPAFRSIDCIAGLTLNHGKCCWVQYGNEEHDSLRTWISETCEEFSDMQIVRHAEYVGSAQMGTSIVGRHRVQNHATRPENQCFHHKPGWATVWYQDLRNFGAEFHWLCMCSWQSHTRSREPCPSVYHSRTAQRYHLQPSCCWLCLWTWPWSGGHSFPKPRGPLLGCSVLIYSPQRSRKSQWGTRAQLHSSLCSFSSFWNMSFFFRPWPFTRRTHLMLSVSWTVMTHLMKFRKTKKKKVAIGLLLNKLHKQDFAGPLACRASKALGPTSRLSCCWHFAPYENCFACISAWVARWLPSNPLWWTVYCTEISRCRERSHMPCWMPKWTWLSLSLQWVSQAFKHLSFFLETCWDIATKKPFVPRLDLPCLLRESPKWHCRYGSLTHFVYAHHKHRLDSANAGNLVRFMAAITPAFAHAYQTICLAMHLPGVPHRSFRLPKNKSRYPHLPNDRSIKRELGNDDRGWAF